MFSVILLSGGVGSRSGKNIPKQYCDLQGKRVINYCLDSIKDAGLLEEIVIVYGDGFLDLVKEIMEPYQNFFKTIKYVPGGETRQDSVMSGLDACSYGNILLHESARPLITSDDLKKVAEYPEDNVTMGIDIPFTVLRKSNGFIESILERETLFNVQLPQKFNRETLLNAHKNAKKHKKTFTDDSSLVFYYNSKVAVINGSEENIKLTTANDFSIAERILNNRNNRQDN